MARYHVEGETSTEGPRWQVWDSDEGRAPFHGFEDQGMAKAFCDRLNEQTHPSPPVVDDGPDEPSAG